MHRFLVVGLTATFDAVERNYPPPPLVSFTVVSRTKTFAAVAVAYDNCKRLDIEETQIRRHTAVSRNGLFSFRL